MVHTVVLDNGVTVLMEEIPHVHSVAIGVWAGVGSRDEIPELAGISHFIEHLMFKGTYRRTAKEIAETLEAVGGQLNAFTAKEFTCYYARVLDEHFDLAVDLLADMIFNSRFDPDDIEREKNVIVEEIKMYEDTPDELVHDVFASAVWQGHSLGRPIIGSADVVRKLSRDDILRFFHSHYRADKMIVAVAGSFDRRRVIERISSLFENAEGSAGKRTLSTPVSRQEIVCREKDTEQIHLCIGTPGLAMGDEKVYVFQVLNTILGGGLSSRLFQCIREQRGLVYSVYSYHSSYFDTGLFVIYAGFSRENMDVVLELICKEIKDIQQNGVLEGELRRAKDQLKGNLLLSLEHVNARMSRLGKLQLYLGKVIPPEEVVEKIEKVTLEEVRDLALEVWRPEKVSLASVGPWNDCKTLREALGGLL